MTSGRSPATLDDDAAAAVAVLRVGGVRSGRPTHLRLHDKLRALNVLSTERRRTYSLNPDDTLADRAGVARAERAALTILRGQLNADDEALMQLAQKVKQSWAEKWSGER